jgi:3D (Asp-Asp-Asp) domain-containing protein
MKGLLVAISLTAILSPTTYGRQNPAPKQTAPPPEPLLARVTVYWASGGRGSDRYTRKHKCATGLRLRQGHCAVDPKKIPYGSNVILPDGTSLAAVDTGTAVRNRKAARLSGKTATEKNALVIDRFFETKSQALSWANSHPHFIPVRVVTPGSTIPRVATAKPINTGSTPPPAQNPAGSHGGLKLPKIH